MKRLCLLLALVSPVSALGADHHMALDELVVQGSALEETLPSELSDYGAELEVIDAQELERTGISDVGQALQGNVPGIYLSPKTGRGDYADIAIQGSRSQDVLWLVDGVRINNRLFGSTSPLDSISTHMVERIEILKGGQGLFYGTQAVAGVVNIVLRKPEKDSGGTLTGAIGSLGDRRLAGHVSNRNDYGRWLVFGEHDHSDGYQPYRDTALQDSARRQKRGFTRSSYGGRYQLDAGTGQSLNVLVLRNDVEADFSRASNNFKAVNDRDEHIVSLKWDHQVNEQNGYFIKAYWHDWWTDYTRLNMDADRNITLISDRAEWGFDDYGINLTGRHTTDDGSQLLGGVDYQRYQGEDYSLRIDGKTEAVTAGFVQYRPHLSFSPSTHLALGARYNHSNFADDHSIWNISLKQPLSRDLNLKASVGTNFRLPSAFEMFVIDEDFPAGNENLEPEESINSNVSLTGHFGRPVEWHLGGFYREIDNLITVQDGQYANSNRTVRVHGAEAMLNLGGDRGWQLDLNATWADAREGGSDEQIADIPEWHANATLSWQGNDQGWQLNARHTGEVATTTADIGRQSYGDHTLLSASAWRQFGADGAHRITLRLENLRDRQYANGVAQATPSKSDPYRLETLGPPRNVQLEYSRSF
ncbi:TonB-dependent receptor [Halospina sp. K52047b]|uniref:TonB-dependent receptor plug domain-containing protein n=1 Tax=Halospina sp. K52047b TaxID=2614160 RepID=UPI001249DF6F|nr:TonB-dependent receptor [Halospina sp. K52047b]KAA8983436.1 TonB-dependent receptor [Halospina sp. K52047b]